MPETYHLVAPSGVTPQVITETVYELFYKKRGWTPAAVHVVTTTTGEAAIRGRLLGEGGHLDFKRDPIAPDDAWNRLCRDVLGIAPPPVHVEVVAEAGLALDDIRTPAEDRAFADACYRKVAELTRAGAPRLVGSISGGRKSMSAHVMNAFSALARPGDLLCHVLVNPARLEGRPDFFYPTDPASEKIDLVELAFPQLRSFLVKSLLRGKEPHGLADLLDAARPHLLAEQRPASADVVVARKGGLLRLSDEQGETLVELKLSPARVSTLLVFANALCDGADGVSGASLVAEEPRRQVAAQHPIHRARVWISMNVMGSADPEPWTATTDVSKTLGELKKALRKRPLAMRFYDIAPAHDGVYRWPEAQPCPLHIRFAPSLSGARSEIEAGMARHFPHLSYGWV